MVDSVERIVNLALLIASSTEGVTAAQCVAVEGYPPGQEETAQARMFERDKDELRAAGLVLQVDRTVSPERYRLDRAATFARPLELTAEEIVLLRSAGAASLGDPSFPYKTDLRMALAKLLRDAPDLPPVPVRALSADEEPDAQADLVGLLSGATSRRKRVRFVYTNLAGVTAEREVEPYGLFAQDGRWYLVGRDVRVDSLRVFAISRMGDVTIDEGRPRHADYTLPEDFDVRAWMLMPFQYGAPIGTAVVRLSGQAAQRAASLTGGRGEIDDSDGVRLWRVPVADAGLLACWAVENGPGVEILEPKAARDAFRDGLEEVSRLHGR